MTFKLTILGSASALPTVQRFSSAQLLNVNERFFLIDCGEGTQIQLRKYKAKFLRINHIFISHLHGDHFFGLFGLLSTFNLLGRKVDLHIYGHKYLQEIINRNIDLFGEKLSYKIIFHDLDCNKESVIYEDKSVIIKSFKLYHKIPTCGFIFEEKQKEANIKKHMIHKHELSLKNIIDIKQGADFVDEQGKIIVNSEFVIPAPKPKKYSYCSDTKYSENIIENIKDSDLLYHEATFAEDLEHRAKQTMHSTAKQAAAIAEKSNAKKLIIGHFSARYTNTKEILSQAKSVFENTVAVKDGDSFEV